MEAGAEMFRALKSPDELKEIQAKANLASPDGEPMEGYIAPEVDDIYKPMLLISNLEFSYEINSLYRYWVLIQSHIKDHKRKAEEQKSNIRGPYALDRKYIFSDTDGIDIKNFPEYLMNSVITFEISILENYLYYLCLEIEDYIGITFEIDEKDKRNFLEKYVSWLRDCAGIEVDCDSEIYKKVDAFRMIRNTFIHNLSSDFPEKAKRIIREAVNGQPNEKIKVDEKLVEASFKAIVEFMSYMEEAYLGCSFD